MPEPKENEEVEKNEEVAEEPKVVDLDLSNLGEINKMNHDIKLKELDGKEVKVSGYLYQDHGNGYYGLVVKPQSKEVKLYFATVDGTIVTKLGKEITVQGTLERGLLTNATLI